MKLSNTVLPMDGIEPDPTQPRQLFDAAKHKELTESIREHGLLEPIIVRKDLERRAYRIVAGERRFRCCRQAGLEKIPVRIIDGELNEVDLIKLQLTENLDRDDLKPAETARALSRLQDALQCTREQLAQHVHKSPATISRLLNLLQLPKDLQDDVDNGKLSMVIAVELVRCPTSAIQQEIANAVMSGEMNRKGVIERVQAVVGKKSQTTKSQQVSVALESGVEGTVSVTKDAELSDWISLLQQTLKACHKVKRRHGDIADLKTLLQKPTKRLTKKREVAQ